jgi:hypothetical protein
MPDPGPVMIAMRRPRRLPDRTPVDDAAATRAAPMLQDRSTNIRRVQVVPSPNRSFLLAMLAEFTRACAAAQRYEDLRHRSASRVALAPDEIPRRIFEEFYCFDQTAEVAPPRAASAGFTGKLVRHRKGVVSG